MFFVFVGLVMMALSGSSLGTGTSEHHNHNEDNHDALCTVLKAVVTLENRPRSGEKLKKALARAIFGNESGGGDIETLKKGLPETHHKPGNRKNWCGDCTYGGDHYPGKSIPHDLLCMCTVGEGGHPFTHYSHERGIKTLCGRSATDFGCEKNQQHGTGCHNNNTHWWKESSYHQDGNREAKVHLNVTWEKVVKPCLEKIPYGQARKTLLEKLKVGHQQSPSWAWGHGSCNGVHGAVCVNYSHQCREGDSPQWWQELYDALTATEDTRAKGKSTRSTRKRTRRNTGDSTAPDEPEDESEEDELEDSGADSTNNRPRQLPLLSHQQSSTPLIPLFLCLLSASLFI